MEQVTRTASEAASAVGADEGLSLDQPEQAIAAQEIERQRLDERFKLRAASLAEIFFCIIVAMIYFGAQIYFLRSENEFKFGIIESALLISRDYTTLAVACIVFFEVFRYMLTGSTYFVSIYSDVSERRFYEFSSRIHLDDYTNDAPPFKIDPTEKSIARMIKRSEDSYNVALGRPNALLFVGTTIAGCGLIFFLLTLPGFIVDGAPPDSVVSTGTGQVTVDLSESYYDITQKIIDLSPRLFMLIFIQLLAGFFLRQYRASMEEVRYYDAILRYREALLASYLIRKEIGEGLGNFSELLLDSRDNTRLKQGETTLVLEALRSEQNEFKSILESVTALLKSGQSAEQQKNVL